MPLREADALNHLRFKQSLIDSDCNAVYQVGETRRHLPVLIHKVNGAEQFLVEIEDQFFAANKVNGFLRFELKPGERQEPALAETQEARSTKLKVQKRPGETDWMAARRAAAEQAAQTLADRHASRFESQGIRANQTIANAVRRENEQVAARLKPKRY